jgi:hypothetical protein
VGVEVAEQRKLLRVTGDRTASHRAGRAPVFTDPVPFATMPIRYERAYGGQDHASRPDAPFHYPRNPLGCGIAVRNVREAVEGLRLPNLEDPEDALTPERLVLETEGHWNEQPLSQGLGWFQKTWYPRCSFVGAMPSHVDSDAVMREERLGLVPSGQIALARRFRLPSFDVRFNNGASIGLAVQDLRPGSRIRLAHVDPEPLLSFHLPQAWPRIALDIGQGPQEVPAALHTVLIEVEPRRVNLIWRGALPYPGSAFLPSVTRLQAEAV